MGPENLKSLCVLAYKRSNFGLWDHLATESALTEWVCNPTAVECKPFWMLLSMLIECHYCTCGHYSCWVQTISWECFDWISFVYSFATALRRQFSQRWMIYNSNLGAMFHSEGREGKIRSLFSHLPVSVSPATIAAVLCSRKMR